MASRKRDNKFPADAVHHVVEFYRGPEASSSEMASEMLAQAVSSGNTVRAISQGVELVAYVSTYPSVRAFRSS